MNQERGCSSRWQRAGNGARRDSGMVLPALLLALLLAITRTVDAADLPHALGDAQVKDAVESAIMRRPAVPFDRIDVTVANGVVTLSGRAGNLLARDEALDAAGGIRGVRAVIDQIAVVPPKLADAAVRGEVLAALHADPAVGRATLDVDVKDGVVTLRGTAESWAERLLAERIVKGVSGVRAIDDAITIKWKAARSDAEIAADVRGMLAADAQVGSGLVDVAVDHAVVKLSGAVASVVERQHAIADAYVNGVNRVDAGGLTVRWWQHQAMAASKRKQRLAGTDVLAHTIEEKWRRDPYLTVGHPAVTVMGDGIANLSGTVDSLAAKRQAEWLAATTVGVSRVRNHLRVRPAPAVPDPEIAKAVQGALRRDPLVDAYELWCDVRDGVVRVLGKVDSLAEKRRAGDVVAAIKGVVDVHNLLEVASLPTASANDRELRDEIRQQLFWSPFVDANQIRVSVRSGVATLRGVVDSDAAKMAAEVNAHEAGAHEVLDQLQVKGDATGFADAR
jgi:osmotically-inducible protein OsmY